MQGKILSMHLLHKKPTISFHPDVINNDCKREVSDSGRKAKTPIFKYCSCTFKLPISSTSMNTIPVHDP
ncbi:hypothetical protein LguiB_013351 [Lonicera macranthoides]